MEMAGFGEVRVVLFRQLPFLWRHPWLKPLVGYVAALPLPYRPFQRAPWPEAVNKLIRFGKEVMLLGTGVRP